MKIKKLFATMLFLTLTAGTSFALPGIPNGVYVGEGKMRTGAGPKIPYKTTLTLTSDRMSAVYEYPTGSTATYTSEIIPGLGVLFEIKDGGETIGTGYCEESMCHLDVSKHDAEETIIFHEGKLLRLGSMQHGPVKLTYSETLLP